MTKSSSVKKSSGDEVRRCIAFLRGVNLGGRTVKSPQLVAAFQSGGFTNVATFIASGNVVFDSIDADLEPLHDKLDRMLTKHLGFAVETFIRTIDDLRPIAKSNPFKLDVSQQKSFNVNIAFFRRGLTPTIRKKVLALTSDYDDFWFKGREMFWLCRGKMSESTLFEGGLAKIIGRENTMRNHRTVVRLIEKFG